MNPCRRLIKWTLRKILQAFDTTINKKGRDFHYEEDDKSFIIAARSCNDAFVSNGECCSGR